MNNLHSFPFQKLNLDGLKTLVSWAKEEGWNPGVNDAELFYNTDPDGFYGYFHNNELIAGGSIVSYDGNFGFMGFFIVRPDHRGFGIGRQLWHQRRDTLLARLKPGATIGMDGVVAMQPFYHKGGFEVAFRDERYERTGTPYPTDNRITSITEEDIPAIMDYDKQCFGFPRPHFMIPWLSQPQVKIFKFVEDATLKGFAVLRKADKGYRICPLFADDAVIAEELYKACLNSVPGEVVYIDIPVTNEGAMALVKKYNTAYVFECARMYLGKVPDTRMDKVFGITTFELG